MAIQTKKVKSIEYLYFTRYSNGKKREVYCGLASNPKSKKKALELEFEELQTQKKILAEKAQYVKNQISKIKI